MHGVVLDLDSLHPDDIDLQPLRDSLPAWELYGHTENRELRERLQGATVVVTNKVPLDRPAIVSASELRLICVAATGTDIIDLQAAREAGITVCNARGYATASVVEHVFALLLTLTRHLDSYRRAASSGAWSHSPEFCYFGEPIGELAGRTLGIVGYGVLGRAVAEVARALGMKVLVAESLIGASREGRVPLKQLLREADVLSLHCPLTAQTRGLIGAPELQCMKDSAILVNTARGGLVVEEDLVRALQEGWIAAAAVDVLAQEPPRRPSPLLEYRSERLIVTPHAAWASVASRQRLVDQIAANIDAFLKGEPRNQVV